ncbi:hypothetical protein [uncultured Ruminococcus sp.]|uniref:hypothetical protein n=1 Tax=uncultured Ruminococcus sp. TaxID=165186 RepID=UPI0025CF93F6|nr:hypothetical protein [uncultured Ruminococcus sp.]
MKIEKITDAFVNEFDGQVQSCSNDCTEYFGKTLAVIKLQINAGIRKDYDWDSDDCKNVIGCGEDYCYRDHTPKTTIYW